VLERHNDNWTSEKTDIITRWQEDYSSIELVSCAELLYQRIYFWQYDAVVLENWNLKKTTKLDINHAEN